MAQTASLKEDKRDYGVKMAPGVFPEEVGTVISSTNYNRCLLVNHPETTDISVEIPAFYTLCPLKQPLGGMHAYPGHVTWSWMTS